jgi:ABC-type transporter Mla subunit MlaD
MHYLIIFVIIAIIVFFQIKRYKDTIRKINIFKNVFASKRESYTYGNLQQIEKSVIDAKDEDLKMMLKIAGADVEDFYFVEKGEDGDEYFAFNTSAAKKALIENKSLSKGISSSHRNPIFNEIKDAINSYLSNNKGSVSDFHLMKDIVDRNCDAKEEEINTQIPVPLYLGLMGTMAGILIGIGYLWFSGDLSALLNAGNGNSGAEGVEALLGGVALAMISSILGIFLTTSGSMKAKEAKAEEEKNKHMFLSWIQANLLPNLSNDTAQTLVRMSTNLVAFNNTFSNNTAELGKALSQVNEATKLQSQLMQAVEKLADKNISKQNLEVYNALKNSSEEIGTLAKYLNNSNEYLAAVRELNEKLDKDEKRSKAVERMAAFFENEATQIEQRKALISKTVGEIDSQLEEQLRKLGEHASENVNNFYLALGKQQDALQKKLDETQVVVNELKNLSSIKDSISKFEKATAEQNRKIDRLTENIKLLAEAKAEDSVHIHHTQYDSRIPVWKKAIIWSSVALGFLVLLSLVIANWNSIYSFLLDVLRF